MLPKEYYPLFCQLNLSNKIERDVRMKQHILKKTGIWATRYTRKFDKHFLELVVLSHKSIYKDVLLMIAGYLFI